MVNVQLPEWVKPGAVFAILGGRWSRARYSGQKLTIAKVYKTGKVKMEGDDRQWSIIDDCARVKGFAEHTVAQFMTPEVAAGVERSLAAMAAIKLLYEESERLDKIARGGNEEELIAAAVALKPAEEKQT